MPEDFIYLLLLPLALVAIYALFHWHKHKKNLSDQSGIDENTEHEIPEPVTRYPSKEEEDLLKDIEKKEEIIGIQEPVGFWSQKIFHEKLPFLLAKLEQQNGGLGFWQQLVLKQRRSRDDKDIER